MKRADSLLLEVKRQATYRLVRWEIYVCSNLFFLILVDTSPFVGPLIPLFWTSGVSSGVQSQSGHPYLHLAKAYVIYVSPRFTSVATLLTSWQPAWQMSHSYPHTYKQTLVGLETGIYPPNELCRLGYDQINVAIEPTISALESMYVTFGCKCVLLTF